MKRSDFLNEEVQARVAMGAAGQTQVVDRLKQQFGDAVQNLSVAAVGKTTVDISATIDGTPIRLEVKTVNNPNAVRTAIYDTVMSLDSFRNDPIIDKFVSSATGSPSFNMWIRKERRKNKSVGYPGQEGVTNKTGKLPKGRTSSEPAYLNAARNRLAKKLAAEQINYFVIYHAPYNTIYFFHTGFGDNPLSSKKIPMPSAVMLDTYGNPHGDVEEPGAYVGVNRMRVALKASFRL